MAAVNRCATQNSWKPRVLASFARWTAEGGCRCVSLSLGEGYRIETLPSYNGRVKPTIYVVEDDPDISRLVRHHLEGASFNVRLYSTGNLVVVDAERQRPALFLLDIMVPGKDGLELCRQIRNSLSLAPVPVHLLTAKRGDGERVPSLGLRADRC